MTTSLALEYIPRRMCELCYSDYHIRFRHLLLQQGEERVIAAHNQLFILVEPPNDLRVESTVGIFDLGEDLINELQYEHYGEIVITNRSAFINHVQFIQVIPKLNTCQ